MRLHRVRPRLSRRSGAALLLVLAVMLAQLALGAGSASAEPWSCKNPPTPEYPGAGLVGRVDTPEIGRGAPNSIYDQYSYAGQAWNTYDTGCMGSPDAAVNNWAGNQLFNAGKLMVAATNGLHWLQQDGGALRSLDNLITEVTANLYDNAFVPWIGLALAIAAIALLSWTIRGNLARVGRHTLYVLAGLTFASCTFLTPLIYTHLLDGVLINGVNQVQTQLLAGEHMNARNALPTILHNQVVYKNWLAGEFGSANSQQAQQFGPQLVGAQACSKVETLQALNEGPSFRSCPVKQKENQFRHIGDQLKNTPAYGTFTGKDDTRLGTGFGAAIQAACYTSFQFLAQLGLLLAQLILRAIILAGPIIGLIAVLYNDILTRVFRAAATAIGWGLVLAVTATVHLDVLSWLFDPAREATLGFVGQVFFAALLTAAWILAVKPYRKFRNMMESSLKLAGVETMPWEQLRQKRFMRRMRRSQRHHENAEEQAHQNIYNVVATGNTARPEDHQQQPPRRVPGERMYDPPTSTAQSSAGALPRGGDRSENHTPSDGTGDGTGPETSPRPGGGPSGRPGSGAHGATATPIETHRGSPADPPTSSRRGGSTPSAPHQSTPSASTQSPPGSGSEVASSSQQRSHDEHHDTPRPDAATPSRNRGPRDPSPSYQEHGRRVWRVYRPSSGRVEDTSGGDDSRRSDSSRGPEQE